VFTRVCLNRTEAELLYGKMVKSGSGKKGNKNAAQRKKKSAGPDIPWKEALLAYE